MTDYDNINFEQLLNNCFEIEGLISLMKLREEEAPEEVYALLVEKVAILAHDLGIEIGGDEYKVVVNDDAPESQPELEPVPEAVEEPLAELPAPEEPVAETEAVAEDEIVDMPEPSLFPEEMTDFELADDSEDSAMTLDRKLAREGSADLRSAFSINDKFRFRRELFGNSDVEFADALNLLSAMTTYAEAEEYLYGDLHWNPEGDDVKAFMDILRDHFKS